MPQLTPPHYGIMSVPSHVPTGAMSIPRILHQTWKDDSPPEPLRTWQQTWRDHHPDWDYRLWTDADNRAFLTEHYPWFLPIFDAYPEPVMRADAVRYFLLLHFGGLYVDLDFECLRPFDDELLARGSVLIGLEPAAHSERDLARERGLSRILCNALMASVPEHSFWRAVIAELRARREEAVPLDATGPFMLSAAFERYESHGDIVLLPAELLYPLTAEEVESGLADSLRTERTARSYALHHWHGSWIRRGLVARCGRWLVLHSNASISGAARQLYPLLRSVRRRLVALLRRRSATPSPPPRAPFAPLRALGEQELAQRVLVAVPVKNAAAFLPNFFANLAALDFPHSQLSLAFLESDSDDGSWEALEARRGELEAEYHSLQLFQEHFGYRTHRSRSDIAEQLRRRSIMACSRNRLVQQALGDEDWVLWFDVDVQWWPPNALRCLLAEERDIIVPHCIFPDGETFDKNTFRIQPGFGESDFAPYIVDGLIQPPSGFGRSYLGELRDERCAELDAVGGTMLLVRADLHRRGLVFPEQPYHHYIETEGLSMMARDMGHRSYGLPDLEIIHPRH